MHKCGIGAAVNTDTPFQDMFRIGTSTQNRGYDGCGIALYNEEAGRIETYKGSGRVVNAFLANLKASEVNARSGIISLRYRTTGDVSESNLQPVDVEGDIALSHNGNVFNYRELAKRHGITVEDGDSDSKALAEIIRKSGDLEKGLRAVAEEALGAFNLIVMNQEGTVAVYRDPWGFHPLFKGSRNGATYFASETPALTALHIADQDIEQLGPGELWLVNGKYSEKKIIRPERTKSGISIVESFCPFELSYFMRPDGKYDRELVRRFRERVGARLAQKNGVPYDNRTIVVPVMYSGEPYGIGYSRESGIPMEKGLSLNPDMARLYMEEDKLNALGVSPEGMAFLKNMPVEEIIRGKRLIVVDDSIVRAGTLPALLNYLFEAGAEEINLRIGTPPIISPCHMGFNHSDEKRLRAALALAKIMSNRLEDIEEGVRKSLHPRLASLHYLPIEDYMELLNDRGNHCFGCFTGNYPFPLTSHEA